MCFANIPSFTKRSLSELPGEHGLGLAAIAWSTEEELRGLWEEAGLSGKGMERDRADQEADTVDIP